MVGIEYGNKIHFTQVMFSNKLHLSGFFLHISFCSAHQPCRKHSRRRQQKEVLPDAFDAVYIVQH